MTYYKYVVTAQKPTATQFAIKGSFTDPNELNLILGKGTRLEIYTLTPDGLKPTLEFSIYGTITALDLYTIRGRDKASLFILTARHKFCILSYQEKTQQIITEASGEIGPGGLPHLQLKNTFGTLDPINRYFATAHTDSAITIFTPEVLSQRLSKDNSGYMRRSTLRNKDGRRKSYPRSEHLQINLSLEGNILVSMVFLRNTARPTLAILYDDPEDRRYLETFVLDSQQREFVPADMLIEQMDSDDNDSLLIALPAPVGGVLLVGESAIRYLRRGHEPRAIGIKSCSINCYSLMNEEGSRILLGDQANGLLYLLLLSLKGDTVESLNLIRLGSVPTPSCLAYLDNDVVFVGSTLGDSQLVHIRSDGAANILNVIEVFPNLGPISDFCIADLDKQGQLITCSGAANDSSLRIIRNGVGLNELAAIEIAGVKGVWPLRHTFTSTHDNILLLSFINQTRLLELCDNEMTEMQRYSGLTLEKRTLAAANVAGDKVVQITDYSVRLVETGVDGRLLDEWIPEDKSQITVGSVNPSQCVVSIGHGRLVCLEIQNDKLVQAGTAQLDHEVSCIDITPLDAKQQFSSVAAVGVWRQVGVRLLSLPSLQVVAEESLSGTVMPRSILMAKFEDVCYLLVALGDGQFYNFKLDSRLGKLWDKKRSFLGKMPISLGTFTSNGTMHVFAASDKPSVIHSRNQKLIYSNVNLKDVRCVTSFNSLSFPDAIALTTGDFLLIGQMEEIQKLHITKIPTADTPRRITYQESTRTFGIVTSKLSAGPFESATTTTSGFEILDDQSFEVIDRIYLKYHERILSATTLTFDDDANEYFVLGTGIVSDAYENESGGRILVLQVTPERTLSLVSQTSVDGMVECVKPLHGKLLASITGVLNVFQWHLDLSGHGHLVSVCSCDVPTVSETVTTFEDTIIAGDFAYSVSTFRYDAQKQKIEEIAQDDDLKDITAVEALNSDAIIAAEAEGHLFVLAHATDEVDLENRLEIASQWHLGERIQRFRFGSLGTNLPDSESRPIVSSLIFCTNKGTIGVVADLSSDRFKLLSQMQNNLNKIIPAIGDFSHAEWRSVILGDVREKSINFIDGDLIESFLDLTPQQMQDVVDGRNGGRKLECSVEDLCKVVEELMSVHS